MNEQVFVTIYNDNAQFAIDVFVIKYIVVNSMSILYCKTKIDIVNANPNIFVEFWNNNSSIEQLFCLWFMEFDHNYINLI